MQSTPLWRFGPFEADAAEHRLRRDGEIVPLTRKPFALLATLLSRPGKLFTKAELFELVWAGSVVTDAALSRAIRELRIALGDDAAAPRYIATAHGLGFRFVATVEGEKSDHHPETGATPSSLVAREKEIALLAAALVSARAGHRQMVFVTGEAGIGKTALVEAFLDRHADTAGVWSAQGRCVEQYGTGEAFLPIVEALENLTRQVGARPLRDVLARYAPAWLAQLPWLADPHDAVAKPPVPATITAQGMLREIAHALEVLAAQTPIVLWIEDLHWSDPSSLAALSFIAGRREPARLLVIASFRPGDAIHSASPLGEVRLRLVQRSQASELALGLLDMAAVAAYLRSRFGAAASFDCEAVAVFIHRRTEGNSLFIVAIVDDLVRRGSLAFEGDQWHLMQDSVALDTVVPESLRQLVHHQIEHLGADDRRLLEAAAVAGTDFSAAAVAGALRIETLDVEDRCRRLAEQGRFLRAIDPVAWPDGTVASGFGFLHALYWQATYERVSQSRRVEWQHRIGLREEAAYGEGCTSIAAELAMRFEAARDFDRSVRYLQLAGVSALARCAYRESIDHLRRALDMVGKRLADKGPRQELDLLLPLGAALMATQGYGSDAVEALYQRALVLCRSDARPGEFERVLRGLWNVLFTRGDTKGASVAADELLARALASGHDGLTFDAFVKIGQTCMHRGDHAGARTHLEHAFAQPSAPGDTRRLRESPPAAAYHAWVLWHTGYPDQAMARGNEALELARRAASPLSTAFALAFVSWLHVFRGEIARASVLAEAQRLVSVEHDLVYWRVWAEFTRGMVAAHQGHPLRGAEVMSQAIDAMRATGAEIGLAHFHCLLARAETAADRPGRARSALMAAAGLVERDGNSMHSAEAARLRGEVALIEGNETHLEQLAQHDFQTALHIARAQGARSLELRAATSLAKLWHSQGETSQATELLSPLLRWFSEGWDTADLQGARLLLANLTRAGSGSGVPIRA